MTLLYRVCLLIVEKEDMRRMADDMISADLSARDTQLVYRRDVYIYRALSESG